MRLRRTMLLAFITCLQFSGSAHGGTLTHGGDGIITLFEEARHSSIKLLNTLVDMDSFADDTPMNIRKYVLENKMQMIEDIKVASHVWNEQNANQEKCALTETIPSAPIQFSLAKCRQTSYNLHNAMQVIIHETIHHLGIADELFCDQLAMYLSLLNDPSFKTVGVWQEVKTSPCKGKGTATEPLWPYVNDMSYGDGKLLQLKMGKNKQGTVIDECAAIYDLKKKVWEKIPLPPISLADYNMIYSQSLPIFYKGKVVFHFAERKQNETALQTILTYTVTSKKWTRVEAPAIFQPSSGDIATEGSARLKIVGLNDKIYFLNDWNGKFFFVSYSLIDQSFEVLDFPQDIKLPDPTLSLTIKDNRPKIFKVAPRPDNYFIKDIFSYDYDLQKKLWVKSDSLGEVLGQSRTIPFQLKNDFVVSSDDQSRFFHFQSSRSALYELPKVHTKIDVSSASMSPDDRNFVVLGNTGDFGDGLVYNFLKKKWFSLSKRNSPGSSLYYLGSFEGKMIYFNYGPTFYTFDPIL